MTRRISITLLLSLVGAFAIASNWPAYAIDLPPQGLGRGGPFRAQCTGGYLVGFTGRVGAWIDNVRPICATWNGRQLLNPVPNAVQAGVSQGGGPASASCPNFVSQIKISDTKGDGPTNVIHSVEFHCISQGMADEGWRKYGSNTRPEPRSSLILARGYTGLFESNCPFREVAVGVHGRSGTFVDAIGLICEPVPARVIRPLGKVKHRF